MILLKITENAPSVTKAGQRISKRDLKKAFLAGKTKWALVLAAEA